MCCSAPSLRVRSAQQNRRGPETAERAPSPALRRIPEPIVSAHEPDRRRSRRRAAASRVGRGPGAGRGRPRRPPAPRRRRRCRSTPSEIELGPVEPGAAPAGRAQRRRAGQRRPRVLRHRPAAPRARRRADGAAGAVQRGHRLRPARPAVGRRRGGQRARQGARARGQRMPGARRGRRADRAGRRPGRDRVGAGRLAAHPGRRREPRHARASGSAPSTRHAAAARTWTEPNLLLCLRDGIGAVAAARVVRRRRADPAAGWLGAARGRLRPPRRHGHQVRGAGAGAGPARSTARQRWCGTWEPARDRSAWSARGWVRR